MSALRLGPATLVLFLLSAGCAQAPRGAAMQVATDPGVQGLVDRIRTATAPYRFLDSAVAAGYPREVARCYMDQHMGAMGFHHVNRALVDSTLDVRRPEILIYERMADSSYVLNAVEYIVPYRIWPADSDSVPRVDGWRLHKVDEVSVWGLHVWIWKDNPEGIFGDWNPLVRCPAGTPMGLH